MIMDHASGHSDGAHLAVDVIFGTDEFLLDRGGEGDDFERRTGFVIFWSAQFDLVSGLASATLFGSNVGAFASARISPLRGSRTITVPDLACERSTASCSAC